MKLKWNTELCVTNTLETIMFETVYTIIFRRTLNKIKTISGLQAVCWISRNRTNLYLQCDESGNFRYLFF
jgi:hypothetical protein